MMMDSLRNCFIKAYGLAAGEVPDPESVPYLNIKPRTKARERMFLIGQERRIYNTEPEIEIEVWESSAGSLRDAFEKCEELTEDVLDYLSAISNASLGVDYHQEQIESYEDIRWEDTFYYMAIILMRANMDEEHT